MGKGARLWAVAQAPGGPLGWGFGNSAQLGACRWPELLESCPSGLQTWGRAKSEALPLQLLSQPPRPPPRDFPPPTNGAELTP